MDRDCLPAQAVLASLTASVVIVGFVHTVVASPPEEPVGVDLMFLGLLGLCLLPSLIYLLGVRTCSMVAIFGDSAGFCGWVGGVRGGQRPAERTLDAVLLKPSSAP